VRFYPRHDVDMRPGASGSVALPGHEHVRPLRLRDWQRRQGFAPRPLNGLIACFL
jgi:hypothetical protein